jgi:hypothetical protein
VRRVAFELVRRRGLPAPYIGRPLPAPLGTYVVGGNGGKRISAPKERPSADTNLNLGQSRLSGALTPTTYDLRRSRCFALSVRSNSVGC